MSVSTTEATERLSKVKCGAMLWDIPVELDVPADVAGDVNAMQEWLNRNDEAVVSKIVDATKTREFQVEVAPSEIDGRKVDFPPLAANA